MPPSTAMTCLLPGTRHSGSKPLLKSSLLLGGLLMVTLAGCLDMPGGGKTLRYAKTAVTSGIRQSCMWGYFLHLF